MKHFEKGVSQKMNSQLAGGRVEEFQAFVMEIPHNLINQSTEADFAPRSKHSGVFLGL